MADHAASVSPAKAETHTKLSPPSASATPDPRQGKIRERPGGPVPSVLYYVPAPAQNPFAMEAPMKFSSLLRREAVVVAFMCLLAVCQSGPLFGQSTPALFSEVGPANDQGAPPAGTRRARRAALRADLLASALQPGTDARPAFVLNLFADVRLRIERERLERDGRGHVSWVGHVQGDPNSTVALTWNGTAVKGGVVAYGSAFEISPSAGGLTLIVERDLTQAPVELPARPVPPGRKPGDELGDRVAADAFTANIDILVLYTPAARMKVGGASHLQSRPRSRAPWPPRTRPTSAAVSTRC